MTEVTVREAQARLPELLAAVELGEIVEIQNDDGRAFHLAAKCEVSSVNPSWPGYPHPGSAKGMIEISDD